MGLFGGFKAKFTRNSTTKTKPQEVVCLKYHIQSEFDPQDAPLSIPNDIKKNEVIRRQSKTKVRKPLTKSAIFQDSDTSNTSLSSPQPQKSQSLLNLNGHAFEQEDQQDSMTLSTTIDTPGNSRSADSKFTKPPEERSGVVAETVAVVTNNHLASAKDKKEKRGKTVLKTFSAHEEKDAVADGDQSTLIFMTQHSSETSDKNVENGEDNFELNFSAMSNRYKSIKTNTIESDGNFDINVVPDKSKYNEEDEFKVNVVQHDFARSYSYSEDEKSFQEEEPLEFTTMGFSSQAASIFFGQDVEPVQPRPRRILLKEIDEDDRRSSGADC